MSEVRIATFSRLMIDIIFTKFYSDKISIRDMPMFQKTTMSFFSLIIILSSSHAGSLYIVSQFKNSSGIQAGTEDSGFVNNLGTKSPIISPVSNSAHVVFLSSAPDFDHLDDGGEDSDVFISSLIGNSFLAKSLSLRVSFSSGLGQAKSVAFGGSHYVEVREDKLINSVGRLLFWRDISQTQNELNEIVSNLIDFNRIRLSDNGQYLVAENKEFATAEIYLRELSSTGAFTLISVKNNIPAGSDHPMADSNLPDVSDSGKQVVFESADNGFVMDDTNGETDIFLWNNGTVKRINKRYKDPGNDNSLGLQTATSCNQPVISGDGKSVFFVSADNLIVPNDTNNKKDIFLYNIVTESINRINLFDGIFQGDDDSDEPDCDGIGRTIVFRSKSSNYPGSVPGKWQIYLLDTVTGKLECVSLDTNGLGAESDCFSPAISPNGRYITFSSNAANLTGSDNNVNQVFLYDRNDNKRPVATSAYISCPHTGDSSTVCDVVLSAQDNETPTENLEYRITSLPSSGVVKDSSGADIDLNTLFRHSQLPLTFHPAVNTSGIISFSYQVSDGELWSEPETIFINVANSFPGLFSSENRSDVLLSDGNQLANKPSPGGADARKDSVSISGDGRWIAFASKATNLTIEGKGGVFLRDTVEKRTHLLKEIAVTAIPFHFPTISLDGSAVIFVDINNMQLFWVRIRGDGSLGVPKVISVNNPFHISISADGRRVVFDTFDALIPEQDRDRNTGNKPDPEIGRDVYLWKPATNEIVLVSQGKEVTEQTAKSCIDPFISPDGERVVFLTKGSFTGDDEPNAKTAVWVKYLTSGNIKQISDSQGDMSSPTLSWTGKFLAFSVANKAKVLDLTKPKANNLVRDFQDASHPHISADGRYLYLASSSNAFRLPDNLSQPTSDVQQAYRYDLYTNVASPLSLDDVGNYGNKNSFFGSLSEDGQFAVFVNNSTNFSTIDNGFTNTFRMGLRPVNNSKPTLTDFNKPVIEDTPTAIGLPASDTENNDLRYEIISMPVNGVLGELKMPELEEGDPHVTYIPKDNFFGTDTLTYRVRDAGGYSSTASVTINVESAADPPVLAVDDVWIFKDSAAGNITRDKIKVSDVDYINGIPDDKIELKIEQLPVNGVLKFGNNNPVQLSDSISLSDFPISYTLNDPGQSADFMIDKIKISSRDQGDPPGLKSAAVEMTVFTGALTQAISLDKGWNLISFSLKPLVRSLETIVKCSDGSSCIVGKGWYWDSGVKQMKTVDSIIPYQGYWIYSQKNESLVNIPSRPLEQLTTDLSKGWNLLGPAGSGGDRTIMEIRDKIERIVWVWNTETQLFTVAESLKAGTGYWMYANGMITDLDLTLK